ncbi:MAG: TPM domain-containing protein, partial [Paraclostridium sp.]
MSRKFKVLIFLFVCLIALLPIRVEAAETDNVKDYLNYLSETEVQELQSRINEISNKCSLDTVIVITDNTDRKSSMQYADDFYDNNNYGLDAEKSGILMLVNMNAREVWISTKGAAITIFTDSTIKTMVNDITRYLSDKDY